MNPGWLNPKPGSAAFKNGPFPLHWLAAARPISSAIPVTV